MSRTPLVLLLLAVCLLPPRPSPAVDRDTFRHWDSRASNGTGSWAFNGRGWTALDLRTKAAYALGMVDGGFLLSLETAADPHIAADESLRDIRAEIGRRDVLDDIIPAIDRFYSDVQLLDIPVVEAYRHVLSGWRGVPEEALQENRARLAHKYSGRFAGL